MNKKLFFKKLDSLLPDSMLKYFIPKRVSKFLVNERVHNLWSQSKRGSLISVEPKQILNLESKIFAIGSCFAREIRSFLRQNGYSVAPDFSELRLNSKRQKLGKFPSKDNLNYYDTAVIRQEIELALKGKNYQVSDFFSRTKCNRAPEMGTVLWQDPYRFDLYGLEKEDCLALSNLYSSVISKGIREADIIIITLGLIETWRNKKNGLFVCVGPSGKNDDLNDILEFKRLNFSENLINIQETIHLLKKINKDIKIVLTVSPVPLGKTITNEDVVVANMQSKATLRAVAGEIIQKNTDVYYWPSYEFAMAEDVFSRDGRHVVPNNVSRIVNSFLASYKK